MTIVYQFLWLNAISFFSQTRTTLFDHVSLFIFYISYSRSRSRYLSSVWPKIIDKSLLQNKRGIFGVYKNRLLFLDIPQFRNFLDTYDNQEKLLILTHNTFPLADRVTLIDWPLWLGNFIRKLTLQHSKLNTLAYIIYMTWRHTGQELQPRWLPQARTVTERQTESS